jgi:lipopolysaccharide export system protein LptA
MPTRLFKSGRIRLLLQLVVMTVMAGWLACPAPDAAIAAETQPAAQPPIHIVADRLVAHNESRSAEFIGRVRVVQGATTIQADRLKLVYKDGEGESTGLQAESIDSIEAVGNVRIEMDDRVAESQRAVYTAADRKLVLTGPGARVISGPNVIEGGTITFYRESGRVEMIGDEKNPVKAIIRSDQRGLN